MPEWSKTNVVDETIAHNILIVRTDKFEPTTSRKQVRHENFLININQ
jgi:hypothetical protein